MARDRKRYDDDDGRTIASMEGVERPSLMGHAPERVSPSREEGSGKPLDLTPEERKWAVLGALKAALAVGFVYLGAIVALVLLLLFIWGQLG